MKKLLVSTSFVLFLILSTGCAPAGQSGPSVAQNVTIESGTIQSLKKVETGSSGAGGMIGGVVGSVGGSIAGSHVGSGTGRAVASVLGAVIGSVVGSTAGNSVDTNYGQQVMVRLNSGRTVVSVLEMNGETELLKVGQAVKVSFTGNKILSILPE
ncbi:MAG: Unknown protein [uncultured Sulfurovum sp.]|uniref:Glycine zipper 2TM domain-containing protein n=1 Tax=uncultured Sulfurovum sp. TaxID=269237 RepID=A0A6S6TQN2_9BACT|nr:MAG: Unknown protein [uncultured Sulfurovum sp.]